MINANSSFPVFIVKNLSTSKEYYTKHFGFNLAFENEWYMHLVSGSGIQIGFMLPNQPTQPEIFHSDYSGKGVIFSLEVDDVENAYSQAQEQKLKIVLNLRSEDWGQRHFSVEDPNGIYLDVVQAIESTEEYQSGYVKE
jgi:catechol 2,3-dioxygenase-like lactoylglutathione lyase family enzyme